MSAEQIAFPLELTSTGQFATVAQGSDGDLLGCVAIALCYEAGTVRGKPDFGASPGPFDSGVDLEALRVAVIASEPRAAGVSDEILSEAAGIVSVQLAVGGSQ